jgi:hypothetical protein
MRRSASSRDAAAITVPTQLLVSGSDYVVERRRRSTASTSGSAARNKERHVLPGFYHDTLGELGRAPAVAAVRRFLMERFDRPTERPSLQDADRHGHTRAEADRLASPLVALSPRGLFWAADTGRPEARRDAFLRRHRPRPRDRLRFRRDARCRLSQPAIAAAARSAGDRPRLSRQRRLARHSHSASATSRS